MVIIRVSLEQNITEFSGTLINFTLNYTADKPFQPNSIRWRALESFESKIFSTASDVWEFACLMIELFTDGEAPFSGNEVLTLI